MTITGSIVVAANVSRSTCQRVAAGANTRYVPHSDIAMPYVGMMSGEVMIDIIPAMVFIIFSSILMWVLNGFPQASHRQTEPFAIFRYRAPGYVESFF